MKRIYGGLFVLVLSSCMSVIEVDTSSISPLPVVNAFWSTSEDEHLVYIATSEALTLSEIGGEVVIKSVVNGTLEASADSSWTVNSNDGINVKCFRMRVDLHPGDTVELEIKADGKVLKASAIVPPEPVLRVSAKQLSVLEGDRPFRTYELDCTVNDIIGRPSSYRLYTPTVYIQGWDQALGKCVVDKEFITGIEIDEENRIFRNSKVDFPDRMAMDVSFVHTGLTNSTHIFTDDSFRDASYSFRFRMDQEQYKTFEVKDFMRFNGIDPDLYQDPEAADTLSNYIHTPDWIKYSVNFSVGSLTEEEYSYLLAYNAALVSGTDPMSEPVVIPSNIEGGLGFFAVESTARASVQLEDCKYLNSVFQSAASGLQPISSDL